METFLAALLMGVCFAFLGIGVLFARTKICLRGSCGGPAKNVNPEHSCSCKTDEIRGREKAPYN